MSQSLVIDLQISADEYVKTYAGIAKNVLTRSRDGRKVRFPANILRPYITHQGIIGSFVITFDEDQKFQSIHKL